MGFWDTLLFGGNGMNIVWLVAMVACIVTELATVGLVTIWFGVGCLAALISSPQAIPPASRVLRSPAEPAEPHSVMRFKRTRSKHIAVKARAAAPTIDLKATNNSGPT